MTNPTADERVNEAPARNDDKTQIRGFTNAPLTANAGHLDTDSLPSNVSALPLNLDSLPSNTNSEWVEPDPHAVGPEVTVGCMLGNRYLLEYKVGEGGMGVVYRASDVEVKGEIFAVKVLKPAIQQRPEALKLLREEVRKTRGLKHPNIVGVYSLNSDPSGAYMLMEFLEGKSLSTLIDEEFGRGMPLMRAWPLINDIGSALAYAHDHNVIHSDLKPSNLFVTVSGKAMLLDFGIARAVRARADRFDTGALGALTPAYATSEMQSGNTPDQSDDVYSFACVIYEMLSGKHPFNSLGAVDAKRVGMQLMPLPTLTHRQNQALAHALAFDRAQRTASVEILLAGLRGPGRRPPPRWLWPAAGAAACLVAGTVAWLMWRGRAPEHAEIASAPPPAVVNPGSTAVPAAPYKEPVARDALPQKSPDKTTVPAATATTPPVREATGATLAAAPAPAPANPVHRSAAPDAKPLPLPAVQQSPAPPAEGSAVAPDAAPASASVPSSGAAAAPADASDAASLDASTAAPAAPAAPAVHTDTGGPAPIGKKVPAIIPLPEAAAKLASCPYPEEARRQVETGTVVLLVYVSPEGAAANTQIDSSSGSTSLDQAAVNCVQEFGQFTPHMAGKRATGYWGRMKFNWSFGE
jgi:TonB family protein